MDKKTNTHLENQSAQDVKEYLENIISLMPGHVYWKDVNGILLGCNDLQAKSAGLSSRHEIVGKTDYELPWKEQADSLRKIDLEVMQSGIPKTVEEISLLADGSIAIFLSKKVPLYQKGKIVGILGVSFDITEKKHMERELTKTKQMLENVINTIPGHVYWKDKNSAFLGCNDAQAKDMGLKSRQDAIGLTPYDISIPKNEAAAIVRVDKEVMNSEALKTIEEPETLPNGQKKIWLSRKVPLRNEKNEIIGVLGVSLDITEQKIAEQKLQEAEILKKEHEIVQHQLAVTKTLAATLAHELCTPLAAIKLGVVGIKGYLEDLMDAYKLAKNANLPIREILPSQFRLLGSALSDMVDETYYSNTIIDMLLINVEQLSLKQREFQHCSIAHCIGEALRRYPFQPDDRNLIYWENKNDFTFLGNELLTVHVLFNLLKNAIYYVKAANKGNVKGSIQIWLELNGKYNILHFKDVGKGMPEAILRHIFDPFFTKTDHGAGIGLTFCKSVMESYGGKISCASKEGEFTEFTLNFPLCDKE